MRLKFTEPCEIINSFGATEKCHSTFNDLGYYLSSQLVSEASHHRASVYVWPNVSGSTLGVKIYSDKFTSWPLKSSLSPRKPRP